MNKIGVMIVDRLTFFRTGLREALLGQGDLKPIDRDLNNNILEQVEAETPDVLLIDIDYPSLSGLDLCQKITRYYPTTPVIVLSSNPQDEQLFEATKSGAVAYLDKNTSIEKLAETIRRAYQGEYPINDSLLTTPRVAERVLKQFHSIMPIGKTADGIVSRLTQREIQILNHIACGNTNKEIAYIVGISEQTIKNHVSAILRKLNANCRAEAVALTIRQGLILLEEDVPSLI